MNEESSPLAAVFQPSHERRAVFKKVNDFLFGYDFFISYAWRDARTYAVLLAENLQAQGFECFLDSRDYAKGEDWRSAGVRALQKTSQLLLLGSPESLISEPILHEVRFYQRMNRLVVPIDFGGTFRGSARSTPLLRELTPAILMITEEIERLSIGPSEHVLRDIRSGFDLMRQQQKRQRGFAIAAGTLALLAGLAIVFWILASLRATQNERLLVQADSDEATRCVYGAEFPLALAHMARAMRRDPSNQDIRALCGSILETRGWLMPVCAPIQTGSLAPVFSPDGLHVLCSTDDGLQTRIVDVLTGEPLPCFLKHAARLTAAAFSPDSTQLATGLEDGTVQIWNISRGQPKTLSPPHTRAVRCVCFNPTGDTLASGAEDEVLNIRSSNGELLAQSNLEQVVDGIRFIGSGSRIVVNGEYLLDARSGKTVKRFPSERGAKGIAGFDARDKRLVTRDGQIIDIETGKMLAPLHTESAAAGAEHPPHDMVIGAAFSEDAKTLIVSTTSAVGIADPATGTIKYIGAGKSPLLSGDGTVLAVESVDASYRPGEPRVARARNGSESIVSPGRLFFLPWGLIGPKEVSSRLQCFAMNRSGSLLVGDYTDGVAHPGIALFSGITGTRLTERVALPAAVITAHFSPDQAKIIVTTADGLVRSFESRASRAVPAVYDTALRGIRAVNFATRECLAERDEEGKRMLGAVSVSDKFRERSHVETVCDSVLGDGSMILGSHSVDSLDLIPSSSQKLAVVKSFTAPDTIDADGITDDGTHVWAISNSKLWIWDARSGWARRDYEVIPGSDGKLSNNGRYFAAIKGETATLYDLASGARKWLGQTLKSPSRVEFTPDSASVLLQGEDLLVWDLSDVSKLPWKIPGPLPANGAFAVLGSQRKLLTLTERGELILSAMPTLERLSSTGFPRNVNGFCVSSDGGSFAVESADGGTLLFSGTTGQLLSAPLPFNPPASGCWVAPNAKSLCQFARANGRSSLLWYDNASVDLSANDLADLAECVGGWTLNDAGEYLLRDDCAARLGKLRKAADGKKGWSGWFWDTPATRRVSAGATLGVKALAEAASNQRFDHTWEGGAAVDQLRTLAHLAMPDNVRLALNLRSESQLQTFRAKIKSLGPDQGLELFGILTDMDCIDPYNVETMRRRAEVCLREDVSKPKIALLDANKVIESEPSAENYDLRGRILNVMGKPEQAVLDFEKGISCGKRSESCYIGAAKIRFDKEEYKKVIDLVDAGLGDAAPDDRSELLLLRGKAYLRLDNRPAGFADLDEAAKDLEADELFKLGHFTFALPDGETKALGYWKAADELLQDKEASLSVALHESLAVAYFSTGDAGKARDLHAAAIEEEKTTQLILDQWSEKAKDQLILIQAKHPVAK